jgi:hypothetical protein
LGNEEEIGWMMIIGHRGRYWTVLGATLLLASCKSDATKLAEAQALVTTKEANDQASAAKKQQDELAVMQQAEERIKSEKTLEEGRLKMRIPSAPNEFLQVTNLAAIDDSLFNSDRRLTRISVTNKTAYPLTGFSGEVQWLSDQNEVREVTLFKLRGSLAAGDTKTFTPGDGGLDTGTTVSHAHKYLVSFKQVKFLDVAE